MHPSGGVCTARSSHDTPSVLSAIPGSLYNPVERCWGILEQHWNGSLLDSMDAVIRYAGTMTWKGKYPLIELVTTTYQTSVKLTKEAMDAVEPRLQRLPSLEKWFVGVKYVPCQDAGMVNNS